MFKRSRHNATESFLVVLLLTIFCCAIAIMILQGSQTFKQIIEDKNTIEDLRIATSYINMIVAQNDSLDSITVERSFLDKHSALVVKHSGDEAGFTTYIYCEDNYLWELYAVNGEQPDPAMAIKLVPAKAVAFDYDEQKHAIVVNYDYSYRNRAEHIQEIVALKTR